MLCSARGIGAEEMTDGDVHAAIWHSVWVAHVHDGICLAAPQLLWCFENSADRVELVRCPAPLTFVTSRPGVVHALVGYFTAELYKDVTVSTLPETWTEGMMSWFPAVFPLAEAFSVESGSTLCASIHRKVDYNRGFVYYEWALGRTEEALDSLHNAGGWASKIFL
jgi:protein arginine N-methyltransferase 5